MIYSSNIFGAPSSAVESVGTLITTQDAAPCSRITRKPDCRLGILFWPADLLQGFYSQAGLPAGDSTLAGRPRSRTPFEVGLMSAAKLAMLVRGNVVKNLVLSQVSLFYSC